MKIIIKTVFVGCTTYTCQLLLDRGSNNWLEMQKPPCGVPLMYKELTIFVLHIESQRQPRKSETFIRCGDIIHFNLHGCLKLNVGPMLHDSKTEDFVPVNETTNLKQRTNPV